MEILKGACAGTIESSDAYVEIGPNSELNIAVNPKNAELKERLIAAGLPVVDIVELKEKTERITGKPNKLRRGERVVAEIIGREGNLLDKIYSVSK